MEKARLGAPGSMWREESRMIAEILPHGLRKGRRHGKVAEIQNKGTERVKLLY